MNVFAAVKVVGKATASAERRWREVEGFLV
jgi:hypothetical protein